jgi:hypothetical protein
MFYLTNSECEDQRPVLCKEECWSLLATHWSDVEFQRRSEVNRANQYSRKFKPHKGGSSSIAAIWQRMVRKTLTKKLYWSVRTIYRFNSDPFICRQRKKEDKCLKLRHGFIHIDAPNLEEPDSLNTEEATTCLVSFFAFYGFHVQLNYLLSVCTCT